MQFNGVKWRHHNQHRLTDESLGRHPNTNPPTKKIDTESRTKCSEKQTAASAVSCLSSGSDAMELNVTHTDSSSELSSKYRHRDELTMGAERKEKRRSKIYYDDFVTLDTTVMLKVGNNNPLNF